jgi:hypothetical protein
MRLLAATSIVFVACSNPDANSPDANPPDALAPDGAPLAAIPADVIACEHPEYWPDTLPSATHPLLVHFRDPSEAATAAQVVGYLDHAWDVEVGRLGFRPPLDDTGQCGPDGRLDVFLWRGIDECYVDVRGENPATPHDDEYAYLVLDPWGAFGGAIVDSTVAHELNHVFQAVDDWDDTPIVYEMTALFVEDEVYDDDNQYRNQVVDFQAHPDWSIDHDDGYATWFMYGAGLYLRFVRDRYFAGDAGFVGEMWRRLRSPLASAEPDFEDALDQILTARAGATFVDSVPVFAAWRVFTGSRDDGQHLEEAGAMAEPTRVAVVRSVGARIAIEPMTLGSAYIDLVHRVGDPISATIDLNSASTAVEWVVQVVPGLSADRDVLDLDHGPVVVDVSRDRTVVITAIPRAANDPDQRSDSRRNAIVVVTPR